MSGDPRDSVAPRDPDVTRASAHPAGTGELMGPYRLLQQVGEGGMGEVWLAEQTRPVRRQVALKIIKAGMDSKQVIARFEAERQALALMDHPSIARVFDAGATPQGRPYFAMEYVRGEPITNYCDRNRLGTLARLELFIRVCEGVQHAHQKGLIHRDLKPSNVLVTIDNEQPAPKIIDFGVAKATTQHLTERTLFTEVGALIGTPEYMSPEQAELTGLDIDTRTDVYALGVLLYELLTGTMPFSSQDLRAKGLDEIRRIIREVEPPRPSTRLSQGAAASAEVAAHRHTEPARLARQLRGDLDWITMKALEKDRTLRYGSASDLASDLRRYLHDEPVLAGPPSVGYRTRKFVRRHRFGVLTAASIAMLLVVFVVTMALQAKRIAQERDRASFEAATAKQVSDFLVSLFTVSDPSESRGSTLTAREILEQGASRITKDLAGQPEVQARLMATIGTVYTNLGLYRHAEPLLRHALETNQRLLGDDNPETMSSEHQLANLLWYQDNLKEAERLYLDVVARRERILGVVDPRTLRAKFDLGTLYWAQNRLDDAERTTRETLDTQRRVLGESHTHTQDSMHSLSSIYYRQGRLPAAEALQVKVLELRRRVLGNDHPETLLDVYNLGTIHDRMGRFDSAEHLYKSAVADMGRVLGKTHRWTCLAQQRLASLYARQKRYEESEACALAAYEGYNAAFGPSHDLTQGLVKQLSELYEVWGRPDEAARWRARMLK
jgi:eukaryotic-like serine/threonine-protein kinase